MTGSTLNRLTQRIMVAGSGCVIVGGVAAFDGTVRGHVAGVFRGDGLSLLSVAGARADRAWKSAADTIGYHGTEDTTLVVFAVAALVLFILMLKT